MAEEINHRFHVTPTLVVGHSGVFNVKLGDELIFSKSKLGRFPETGEVEKVLAERSPDSA